MATNKPQESARRNATEHDSADANHAAFSRFTSAVNAGDDEAAETQCQQLTAADENLLMELARSTSRDERWWAFRALAECGTSQSVALLGEALSAPEAELRQVVALALGHLYQRAPTAVAPHLDRLAALLADPDGTVRQAAMMALSHCGDGAVTPLAAVLAAAHEGARTRAAQGLRHIATMPAAAILYRYLEDPNHLVKTHAYEALNEMGLLENVLVSL